MTLIYDGTIGQICDSEKRRIEQREEYRFEDFGIYEGIWNGILGLVGVLCLEVAENYSALCTETKSCALFAFCIYFSKECMVKWEDIHYLESVTQIKIRGWDCYLVNISRLLTFRIHGVTGYSI